MNFKCNSMVADYSKCSLIWNIRKIDSALQKKTRIIRVWVVNVSDMFEAIVIKRVLWTYAVVWWGHLINDFWFFIWFWSLRCLTYFFGVISMVLFAATCFILSDAFDSKLPIKSLFATQFSDIIPFGLLCTVKHNHDIAFFIERPATAKAIIICTAVKSNHCASAWVQNSFVTHSKRSVLQFKWLFTFLIFAHLALKQPRRPSHFVAFGKQWGRYCNCSFYDLFSLECSEYSLKIHNFRTDWK